MEKKVLLVAGLGFGDECKGATVDYLVRRHGAKAVVRYNGGAQAAHNVVLPDGRHHTFAQFSSGTFVPGVWTFLSKFMVINPFSMIQELRHLEQVAITDAMQRLVVDKAALVTTPYHIAANRLREWLRGKNRNGSCGMGVGETIDDYRRFGEYAVFAGDLVKPKLLQKKLEALRKRKLHSFDSGTAGLANKDMAKHFQFLADANSATNLVQRYADYARHLNIADKNGLVKILEQGPVVFEGAQGVLLDHQLGFKPHVTQADTTFNNAYRLLGEVGYNGTSKKVGVIRSYFTRHGAGPLVTEDLDLSNRIAEPHNGFGQWQGSFRFGHFDNVAFDYAMQAVNGVDELHLTCCDHLDKLPTLKICTAYNIGGITTGKLHTNTTPTQELKQAQPVYQTIGGVTEYFQAILERIAVRATYANGPTFEHRLTDLQALLHVA